MFKDNLCHRCVIYRLQDIADYDFSPSVEGEVDEAWEIVAANVRSRFDWKENLFQRISGGYVDSGVNKVFFEGSTDVKNADRIYREDGEEGPEFYNVRRVRFVRDIHGKLSHKEADLEIISQGSRS